MKEEELVNRLRRRDPTALAYLFDLYVDPVYRLVSRILNGLGSQQDVEECANDVFQLAWERIHRFEPGRAPLLTWLLMLAKYEVLERRRALRHDHDQRLEQEIPGAELMPEEQLVQAEQRQAIQDALAELAPVDKQLVYRRYFLGERVDRIAEAMGLSRQAADNRLWRARRSLRILLMATFGQGVAKNEQ